MLQVYWLLPNKPSEEEKKENAGKADSASKQAAKPPRSTALPPKDEKPKSIKE